LILLYALITGASSGIGKAIAMELAQKKYNLILAARREKELQDLKQTLESAYGITVIVKPADLSIEADCHALFAACAEYHPKIVVNNAGFGLIGAFRERKLEDELQMIRVNIIGLHILTKLFAQSMTDGVILNVASIAAFLPSPYLASYAATKAYVYSFSRAVNYEMKSTGSKVRVLSLCPGPVITEFAKVAGADPFMHGMSAERCAKIAVRGIMKKREVIIPGFALKLGRFLLRFLPLSLIFPIAASYQKRKK